MGKKIREGITVKPYDVFPGEDVASVVVDEGEGLFTVIEIHPWDRKHGGSDGDASVGVRVGYKGKKGRWKKAKAGDVDEWMMIGVFRREDFVEAVLGVFPELKLRKQK